MGQSGSKSTPLTPEELTLTNRKCQAFQKGLAGCRKANGHDAAACKNLEMRVITCYAEEHCEAEATQHRKWVVLKCGRYCRGHGLEGRWWENSSGWRNIAGQRRTGTASWCESVGGINECGWKHTAGQR